jgi:membrane-bound inhibitor of C-type lysozyme
MNSKTEKQTEINFRVKSKPLQIKLLNEMKRILVQMDTNISSTQNSISASGCMKPA